MAKFILTTFTTQSLSKCAASQMRGYKLRIQCKLARGDKANVLKTSKTRARCIHILKDVVQNLAGRFFTVLIHFLQEHYRMVPSLRGHQTLPVFIISAILSYNSIIRMEDSM